MDSLYIATVDNFYDSLMTQLSSIETEILDDQILALDSNEYTISLMTVTIAKYSSDYWCHVCLATPYTPWTGLIDIPQPIFNNPKDAEIQNLRKTFSYYFCTYLPKKHKEMLDQAKKDANSISADMIIEEGAWGAAGAVVAGAASGGAIAAGAAIGVGIAAVRNSLE